MCVFLTGTYQLTSHFIFENEDINLVVLSDLHTTQNISLKVKNLIFLGNFFINNETNLFSAKEDIYFSGKISGKGDFNYISGGEIYFARNEEIVQKIRKFGVDIVLTEDGILHTSVPEGSLSLKLS